MQGGPLGALSTDPSTLYQYLLPSVHVLRALHLAKFLWTKHFAFVEPPSLHLQKADHKHQTS